MSSINSIGSSMGYTIGAMRRPDPQEMFKKIDSDGNGGVSQTELQALTEKISEKSGQSLDATKMLAEYDSNSDGSLGQDEMNSLMESIRPKHERDAMLKEEETGSQSSGLDTISLASYLSNSGQDLVSSLISMLQKLQSSSGDDGSSTESSISGVSGRQGPPPPPRPEDMFKKVDSDSSGSISEDELTYMLEKMSEMTGQTFDAKAALSQFDENSDGSLGEDEMGSMMKSMGPPPPPPQQTSSADSDSESNLQSTLAALLNNSDSTGLSTLLKLLKNYASGNSSSQSINVIS